MKGLHRLYQPHCEVCLAVACYCTVCMLCTFFTKEGNVQSWSHRYSVPMQTYSHLPLLVSARAWWGLRNANHIYTQTTVCYFWPRLISSLNKVHKTVVSCFPAYMYLLQSYMFPITINFHQGTLIPLACFNENVFTMVRKNIYFCWCIFLFLWEICQVQYPSNPFGMKGNLCHSLYFNPC